MSFKLITDDMIVKNNIILEPRITFVSASNLCEDLSSHNIDSAGVYGEIPILNTVNTYSGSNELGTRVYNTQQNSGYLISQENKKIVDILNDARTDANGNSDTYKRALNEFGIDFNLKHTHKFGVEKIKQKFTIDDEGFYKKKAIKNLYNFYNKNLEYRQLNSYWGFSNYNTINFFNVDFDLNNNISNNKTHSNCLAYPNLKNNTGIPAYDFSGDDLTFTFYINQRRKNKKYVSKGYQFNPGCILSIPKLISIFIVKGSQTDINGLTECYRIYIELGNKTLTDTNTKLLSLDFSNPNKQLITEDSFLSTDNILKYNNWHNITITLVKKENTTNKYILKLYNDGILIDNVQVVIDKSNLNSENSFITVGNKFNNISSTNLSEYVTELFSINNSTNDDILGPYSTKSISFGNHNVPFITAINSGFTPYLADTLQEDTSSPYVVKNETSHALNAEIHDVRIYKKDMGSLIKSKICDQNIVDFTDDSLVFSIPVYYYDVAIKKLGLVNMHTTNNGLTRSNIFIDGPVNSYFSNKCLGHEVSVENFLYEFKQKISPNIIFGNNLKDDSLHKSLELIYKQETLTDSSSNICQSAATGFDLMDLYFRKLKSNDLKPAELEIARKNHFYYRNNLILPNDNGLQEQIYDISGYYTSYNGFSHITFGNEVDYQNINLNKVHSEKIAMNITNDFVSSISNHVLMNYTKDSGILKPIENRRNYYINQAENKFFKESYDLFENASINNFHSGVVLGNSNNNMISFKSRRSSFINKGSNFFLKDLSNPVGRKINDDFRSNGIANTRNAIASKAIDIDPNNPDNIGYFSYELPYYNITKDMSETYSNILCISSQIFKKNIVRETFSIFDSSLAGSGGNIKIKLSDNGLGLLYRDDCLTKKAEWNYVGHILYKEGFVSILHPGLENFSKSNYTLDFKVNTSLNVYELNLPAKAGETNLSKNKSYIDNLKVDSSAFNADENFVYITDIDIHDENLNVIANAKVVKPFAKKNTDNVLFRIKMDY